MSLIHNRPLWKRYSLGETEMPTKYRELMGLSVAANIKCSYCAFLHTAMDGRGQRCGDRRDHVPGQSDREMEHYAACPIIRNQDLGERGGTDRGNSCPIISENLFLCFPIIQRRIVLASPAGPPFHIVTMGPVRTDLAQFLSGGRTAPEEQAAAAGPYHYRF